MPGSGNWESLWASLTRSRTILPSRYRAFNPEMQSLWPVLGVGVVASLVVLAMLFYNILNFDPMRPTLSLLKLDPIQAIHAPGTRSAESSSTFAPTTLVPVRSMAHSMRLSMSRNQTPPITSATTRNVASPLQRIHRVTASAPIPSRTGRDCRAGSP